MFTSVSVLISKEHGRFTFKNSKIRDKTCSGVKNFGCRRKMSKGAGSWNERSGHPGTSIIS